MKALVYTGTQELVYREEPNPIEVSGESILKIHASGTVSYTHLTLPTTLTV